jgi:hypothetical protein
VKEAKGSSVQDAIPYAKKPALPVEKISIFVAVTVIKSN